MVGLGTRLSTCDDVCNPFATATFIFLLNRLSLVGWYVELEISATVYVHVGCAGAVCRALSPQFNQATDLAVGSSGQVYVSDTVNARSVVYRLNSTLVQQELVTLPSGTYVVRLALSADESKLVVCVFDRSCISYDAKNLSKGRISVFRSVLSSSFNAVLVSASVIGGGNSFYVGSSNGHRKKS